jgi:hypothetical protein
MFGRFWGREKFFAKLWQLPLRRLPKRDTLLGSELTERIEELVMFSTPPNWIGLLLAAALFALVLAVAPFVTPRGQIISFPNHVASQP